MWRRLTHLVKKEFIQDLQDPRMRILLFLPPLIQLVAYGYAFNLDVAGIRTAVLDFEQTPETRELIQSFSSSGYFSVVTAVARPGDLRGLLDAGTVRVALQIDPGFSRDLLRHRPALLQVLVDGTDSNTAGVVVGYASRVLAKFNSEHRQAIPAVRTTRAGVPTAAILSPSLPAIDLRFRTWYNPDLRSRTYFVPGVIAMIAMLVALQLTAMGIVREREVGTMEQLLVTPLRPVELILGKTVPAVVMSVGQVAAVSAVAVFWFQVPIRGSVGLLLGASALYLLSAVGIGLYISTISKTQQQALMSMAFIFQPAVLLSGFVFPVENMPRLVQYLSLANPIRHYLVIVRGIFLKGTGLELLWPQLLALLLLGSAVTLVSTLRFQRHLD
jgi:ABC-2 type transport system permease protein